MATALALLAPWSAPEADRLNPEPCLFWGSRRFQAFEAHTHLPALACHHARQSQNGGYAALRLLEACGAHLQQVLVVRVDACAGGAVVAHPAPGVHVQRVAHQPRVGAAHACSRLQLLEVGDGAPPASQAAGSGVEAAGSQVNRPEPAWMAPGWGMGVASALLPLRTTDMPCSSGAAGEMYTDLRACSGDHHPRTTIRLGRGAVAPRRPRQALNNLENLAQGAAL